MIDLTSNKRCKYLVDRWRHLEKYVIDHYGVLFIRVEFLNEDSSGSSHSSDDQDNVAEDEHLLIPASKFAIPHATNQDYVDDYRGPG